MNQYNLWKEWYPKVYGYFYRRVDSQYVCEELTAQTMNTVFMAKEIKNFPAYTWKVAHNYLVKFIQSKSTGPMIVALDEETNNCSHQFATFPVLMEAETLVSDNFNKQMEQLIKCVNNHLNDEEDKKLIRLSIFENKKSPEIAEEMKLNPATVRKRLSRLIQKIKSACLHLWAPNHTGLREK